LAVAYHNDFQPIAICHSFVKADLFPFKMDAVTDDEIAPALVTGREEPNDNESANTSRRN
jgi:hypothetical protein